MGVSYGVWGPGVWVWVWVLLHGVGISRGHEFIRCMRVCVDDDTIR